MESYEEWDVTIPSIPSRSRFYCLEPMGMGTSYIECLSSYFVRLANAHCLQPKKLIAQEILPLVRGGDQLPLSADNFMSWLNGSTTMNGATIFTHRWVHVLEQLTARSDMRFLTMLAWNDVIHRRGLVRKTKAWCPDCYKEWRERGRIIYEPLIWYLNSVISCPQHQRPLSKLCPNAGCGKPIPLFADWSRSGYCPHCWCFLGLGSAIECGEKHFNEINANWINNCVGELLAIAPSLTANPSIGDLALKISLMLRDKAKLDNAALAKKLGVSASNLVGWQQGLHTMSFDILLKLCHQLQIDVAQLLMSIEDNKKFGSWSVFDANNLNINIMKIREVLLANLEDSVPPTKVAHIVKTEKSAKLRATFLLC
jgi:transcriptional regulator with XRE-family HTH domain